MNGLSWLVYLASLSDSASAFFSFLAAIAAAVAGAGLFLSLMWTDGSYGGERRIKGYDDMRRRGLLLMPRGLIALVICGGIAVALPGRNTVYAIAASEVGDRMVKSERVQGIADDATKALEQWIKKQIEPEAKK